MKKVILNLAIFIALFFAGASVVSASSFCPEPPQTAYVASIASFFDRFATAYKGSRTDIYQYLQGLSGISTAGCPPRFKAAYIDFSYAANNMVRCGKEKDKLTSGDNVMGTVLISAIFNSSKPISNALDENSDLDRSLKKYSQDFMDALVKMASIATEYGYDPE